MDKLKMESRPMGNILKKVAELCPAAVQGDKIDFERLKEELAPDLVDGNESYNFTWVGKRDAIMGAASPIRKTLRPCMAESKNWDTTKNLYIEGDNLDVLKLLQESYLGKVKMIYIDPPYNTGNDFVYCDDFSMCQKDYMEQKGQCDLETNERLFKNDEFNGRYHSNWCSMMYPRLKVARDLLSDEGVVFISIDDNEVANLKKICDEVFDVFIGIIPRTTSFQRSGQEKYMNISHDYLLCYAKSGCTDFYNVVERNVDPSQILEDQNGHYISGDTKAILAAMSQGYSQGGDYDFEYNGKIYSPVDSNGNRNRWLWTKDRMDIAAKLGILVETGNTLRMQIYLDKVFEVGTNKLVDKDPCLKFHTADFMEQKFDNPTGTAELKKLFDNKEVFSNPKPVELLKYLIKMCTSDKDIIVDFFSGSATTAHAVTQLNAEDGGNRKFIMVQLPENLDKNLKQTTGAAKDTIENAIALCDELGVEHKLTEVAKERIRRAGDKIVQETGKSDIDIGFKVLKLDDTNMKDVYYNPANTTQTGLLDNVDNIKSDRTPLDLLYGVMIDLGLTLDLDVRDIKSGNITYFNVDNASLVACFEQNIPESVIKEIANIKPLRVVFRDLCFADAPGKINVTEIFKTISPNTKITVL
ncbi:MAG: site-specific DNA-methyltransferase [Alphaproteobacteria bacterium]|nr:site-specific DNA-methyltransferase [Alphaproteobacteria bacterium]